MNDQTNIAINGSGPYLTDGLTESYMLWIKDLFSFDSCNVMSSVPIGRSVPRYGVVIPSNIGYPNGELIKNDFCRFK